MTFRTYVRTRRPTESARGDFVKSVKADPDFPVGQTWEQVRAYLEPYDRASIPAAQRMYQEWERIL